MVSSFFSEDAPDLMACVKSNVAECPEKFTKGLHMTLTLLGKLKKEVCILGFMFQNWSLCPINGNH